MFRQIASIIKKKWEEATKDRDPIKCIHRECTSCYIKEENIIVCRLRHGFTSVVLSIEYEQQQTSKTYSLLSIKILSHKRNDSFFYRASMEPKLVHTIYSFFFHVCLFVVVVA